MKRVSLSLILFFDVALAATVFPTPQEIEIVGTRFPLNEQAAVVVPANPSPQDLFLAHFFVSEMSERYGLALPTERVSKLPEDKHVILMGSIANPLVKEYCARHGLNVTAKDPGPEGYVLSVDENVALVAGSDGRGAFYGLQSLRQLVEKDNGVAIVAARIRDWPHEQFRGIKLYLPGRDHIPFFKRFIRDFMALHKFNKVIVELNAAMRLDRHPELNAGWIELGKDLNYSRRDRPTGPHEQFQDSLHQDTGDGGVLEKEEVAELVRWANRHYIEVIPEIPSLTHSYYLLTTHRELAEIPDAEWPDTYCPSIPKVYDLLFDVMDEYIEVMKPKMIHVGHDEWRMPWGVCPRCRDKDPRDLFAQDVNKIHTYLAKRGIRMAMWGDHLLETVRGKRLRQGVTPTGYKYQMPGGLTPEQVKERIPKDILIFNWFWGGRSPQMGEHNDITLANWGFEQVYGNFTPAIENYERRSARTGVLGGAPSSWAATTEFNFGKDLLYDFVGCANLLWSKDWPEPEQLTDTVQKMMPEIRRNLSGQTLPSEDGETVAPLRSSPQATSPEALRALAGLKTGRITVGNMAFEVSPPTESGSNMGVTVGGDVSSLIFLHASAKPAENDRGYRYIYNFPDTADLLGYYEVVYEDGLVKTVPIRYGVNILEWDWGRNHRAGSYCYRCEAVDLGKTFFAFEWLNPRFGKAIKEVRLKGSKGFTNTRGKVIPENDIVLAAVSITRKRTHPEPVNATSYPGR